MKPPHPDWIIPDWPAPANVRAFITTRSGGVSSGPHASFNLGLRADEDPHITASNRAILQQHLPQVPKWLRQVHGAHVVDADSVDITTQSPHADASVAHNARTVCPVMIADCLPVLFTNRAGTRVAGAHAGWRGLAGGVLANTVQALCDAGDTPRDLLAYIGPGIGPNAFEVGRDVYDAFTAQDAHDVQAASAFAPHTPGKWLADLFSLARQALARAGVTEVYGGGLCTYADPARFYSYRRDKVTGRMAAFIWRE
jgi:polyphenol oxidase